MRVLIAFGLSFHLSHTFFNTAMKLGKRTGLEAKKLFSCSTE